MGGHGSRVHAAPPAPPTRRRSDRTTAGAPRLAGLGHNWSAPAPRTARHRADRVPTAPTCCGSPRCPTHSARTDRAPHEGRVMALGGGLDRLLSQRAAHRVDSDEGVTALVCIGSNDNHGGCLLHSQRGVEVGPAGGHISAGAMPRSYQVTPVGPSHPVPALLLEANPKAADAKGARHQVNRNQPPHTALSCRHANGNR